MLEITGRFVENKFVFASSFGEEPPTIIADINCNGRGNNPPDANGRVVVKGQAEPEELTKGLDYRFYGHWTNYFNKRERKNERQFRFNSFVRLQPAGREAIIGYLVNHGAGLGLGRQRATKLWEQFGEDAVTIARTEPARVSEFLTSQSLFYRIGNAEQLAAALQRDEATEAIKLDLTGLLNGRGFPRTITQNCIQKWGNKAAQIIRRDPYRLMTFAGCGFKKCDSMYLDLGLNPHRLKRQAICAWYSINRDNDGHTWFSRKVPDAFLRANIGGTGVKVDRAIELAVRGKLLAEIRTKGQDGPISQEGETAWYAEYHKAENERTIARAVVESQAESPSWPDVSTLNLSDHQKEIVSKALASSICILGGSPGTGKTWAVSEIVIALADKVGMNNILIAAPTGKAAVRVTENLSAKNIPLRARTWHSLLLQLEKQNERHFEQKAMNGDETSMNDTDLMAALIRARPVGTLLLLVGDVHQLPPVGHGAPLRDLIAAGVAYGELTEIVRNSGGIVEACASIRDCKPWGEGDNLSLVETSDRHFEEIESIIQQAMDSKLDPIWDLQILVAVNEKSQLSRKVMNTRLQAALNSQPGRVDCKAGFRVGDKVVNTKNGFFKLIEGEASEGDSNDDGSGEVFVANGELAKVVTVEPGFMVCDLDSPARRVMVFFSQEGGCTFELGYALSVHKSQGSDWPWVVVVLDDYPGAKMVCDRSWLYTSISRAKQRCFLVGRKQTAKAMCRKSKIWFRKTFLRELILIERSRNLVGGI